MLEKQLSFDFRPRINNLSPDELIKQYEPMIHKYIKSVYNAQNSEVCMDYDDLLQFGRTLVWEAALQYREDRGASFTTFVHLKLTTKLMNLGRKIKTRRKNEMINMTSLSSKCDSDNSDMSQILSSDDDYATSHEDSLILSEGIRLLSRRKQQLIKKHYVQGYSVNEITRQQRGKKPSNEVREQIGKIKSTLEQWYNHT